MAATAEQVDAWVLSFLSVPLPPVPPPQPRPTCRPIAGSVSSQRSVARIRLVPPGGGDAARPPAE